MKLWQKLSFMTILVLFLSTGLSGAVLMWHSAYYNEEKTVENYEQQLHSTALALGRELDYTILSSYNTVTKNAYLNYLLKKYGSNRYILLYKNQIACSMTPFALHITESNRWNTEEAASIIQKTGESRFLITGRTVPGNTKGDYTLVLVQDISEIYIDIRHQVMLAIFLYAGGAVLAVLLIFLSTKKILAPLQSLYLAAEDIRCGRLGRRVPMQTRDEIGIVANAFNAMAAQIQQQLTELSDLSRQRGQMLGSLAHELKTPMTSIIGYTDTLLHVKIKENQQKRALTHIYQESRRLERLGSKLMNLIGSYDNESIRLQKTDISDLFARVKALERPNLDKKQIQLHTDCHIGQLLLDSDLFESLLINLIDNAIKASSPGSAVYLTGKENSISVKDEGHGIPSKDLRRVTEAFYMVDKARSRKEGGCGLGLSLCSMIARLHRAELIIDSQEGKGTTVSILFKDE